MNGWVGGWVAGWVAGWVVGNPQFCGSCRLVGNCRLIGSCLQKLYGKLEVSMLNMIRIDKSGIVDAQTIV